MARGRPKLPENEVLVHVSLRIPKDVRDWFAERGNRSASMRAVLENYVRGETDC